MEKLFLEILNLTLSGNIAVIIVITARLIIKKFPKIFSYMLWIIPAFRFICPFSFQSIFSLFPTEPEPVILTNNTAYLSHISYDIQLPENIPLNNTDYAQYQNENIIISIFSFIWAAGCIVMILYIIVNFVRMKKYVWNSVNLKNNIYICDKIKVPFVFGIFKPKIYLPQNCRYECIILHEKIHIKRFDYIFKIIGFAVISVHWFNPFAWIGYKLFECDMEMSCDEKVIKIMGENIKKSYSYNLLSFSTGGMYGITLQFGKKEIKRRIENVLNYKKSKKIIIVLSSLFVTILFLCFITNPVYSKQEAANADLKENIFSAADLEYDYDMYYSNKYNAVIIRKTDNIKMLEDIEQTDDYLNKKYSFAVYGNVSVGDYKINNKFIENIHIEYDEIKAVLTVYENQITAFETKEYSNCFMFIAKKPSEVYEHIAIINPGHGGQDKGMVGNGKMSVYDPVLNQAVESEQMYESILNVILARTIEYNAPERNIKIYSIRHDDNGEYGSLEERLNFADSIGGVLLDIHYNSDYDTSVSGGDIWFYSDESKILAEKMYNKSVFESIGMNSGLYWGELYYIKNSKNPSITINFGTLSSEKDREIINGKNYMYETAQSVLDGLCDYWGIKSNFQDKVNENINKSNTTKTNYTNITNETNAEEIAKAKISSFFKTDLQDFQCTCTLNNQDGIEYWDIMFENSGTDKVYFADISKIGGEIIYLGVYDNDIINECKNTEKITDTEKENFVKASVSAISDLIGYSLESYDVVDIYLPLPKKHSIATIIKSNNRCYNVELGYPNMNRWTCNVYDSEEFINKLHTVPPKE